MEANNLTHSHSLLQAILKSPLKLLHMSLDREDTGEPWEEPTQAHGGHASPTQNGGTEPRTFL